MYASKGFPEDTAHSAAFDAEDTDHIPDFDAEKASESTSLSHMLSLTVLHTASGAHKHGPEGYSNMAPWILKLLFLHTYYAYIYVFLMFVLAFYKGYALVYPEWRRWFEMVLITSLPVLHHLRFFFGYWGCELGMFMDLCSFVLLSAASMLVLMYFLFMQCYIMPLDSTFLFIGVVLVGIEGTAGAINALQSYKLQNSGIAHTVVIVVSVLSLLTAIMLFALRELLPTNAMVEETVLQEKI
mmetsp:Transcript_135654/g.421462  ORF Transcript_135654/g.421462 Transcript_135654/m.421462 type:complete len:241 (-) Transcript_135654:32-754(-)